MGYMRPNYALHKRSRSLNYLLLYISKTVHYQRRKNINYFEMIQNVIKHSAHTFSGKRCGVGQVAITIFLLLLSQGMAMGIGNPAEPALLDKGIFFKNSTISFRIGYLNDWVYRQRFQEEFFISEKTRTKNQLSTYAGIATLNFIKRLDLYTFLGSSLMQVDQQIFSKREFSWCVGGKLVFLKHKNFFLGIDAKYFETDQKPQYFVIQDLPYNILNQYTSKCYDLQAALGMSYRVSCFLPYVNATYIYSHISAEPPIVLIRFPDIKDVGDVEIPSLTSRKRWGMAVGFSLIDLSKAVLALEWRCINQNGINLNGEIRF